MKWLDDKFFIDDYGWVRPIDRIYLIYPSQVSMYDIRLAVKMSDNHDAKYLTKKVYHETDECMKDWIDFYSTKPSKNKAEYHISDEKSSNS